MSYCAGKVSHGAEKVSNEAGRMFHGAWVASNGAKKVSNEAGKVSYGARKVSLKPERCPMML